MPATIPTVAQVEQQIIDAEGPYHVRGVYYPPLRDAERQRRWAAQRIVRGAIRRAEHQTREPQQVA